MALDAMDPEADIKLYVDAVGMLTSRLTLDVDNI